MRYRRLLAVLVGAGAVLVLSATAFAAVIHDGKLRITISAQVQPYRLPRVGTAPIGVFLAGRIATTDHSTPPQLQRLDVKLNRHGVIDSRGMAVCRLREIQPASNERALGNCGDALIGSGHFWASIVLPDQPSYRTTGRLLAFNGRRSGKPVLFAHIYTTVPFPSSFVVTFTIRHIATGPYGTELTATLPQALGNWGYVDRIKMTLGRSFRDHGRLRGYLNAGCPAPKGLRAVVFPLALTTFSFAGGRRSSTTIERPCGVLG